MLLGQCMYTVCLDAQHAEVVMCFTRNYTYTDACIQRLEPERNSQHYMTHTMTVAHPPEQ